MPVEASGIAVPPVQDFHAWMKLEELSALLESVRSEIWGVDFFRPEHKHIREAITAYDFGSLLDEACRVRLPQHDADADFEIGRGGEEMRLQAVEVLDQANTRRGSTEYFTEMREVDFDREHGVALDEIPAQVAKKAGRLAHPDLHLVLRMNLWVPDLTTERVRDLVMPWSATFAGIWYLRPRKVLAQLTPELIVYWQDLSFD